MTIQTYDYLGLKLVRWQLNTCGLSGIMDFRYNKQVESPSQLFDDKAPKDNCGWKTSSLIFAFSSTQYLSPETHVSLHNILKDLGTRIIYWYKNDAHGPNVVFIAMHHQNLKVVEKNHVKDWNNVERVMKHHYYKEGNYHMKPEAENEI